MHISHLDFLNKLKETDTIDLLYLLVEAKAGRHIDILKAATGNTIEAETAVNKLINACKALPDENH